MFVIIVGGGMTGSHLASLLLAAGHQVRVIEWRPQVFDRLKTELPGDSLVRGDGNDPKVLIATGIRQADVLAAVTGDDEDNIVACTLARFEFDVPRIITRVNNPKNSWLFTPEMGVDVIIDQADLIARLIQEEMSLGDMMTLVKLRKGQFSLVEEKISEAAPAAGQTIHDPALPDQCVLTAILRGGNMILPRGDIELQPGDEVVALVHASQLDALAVLLGGPERLVQPR